MGTYIGLIGHHYFFIENGDGRFIDLPLNVPCCTTSFHASVLINQTQVRDRYLHTKTAFSGFGYSLRRSGRKLLKSEKP